MGAQDTLASAGLLAKLTGMALTILLIGSGLGWIADPNRSLPFLTSDKPAVVPPVAMQATPLAADLVPKDLWTNATPADPTTPGGSSPAAATIPSAPAPMANLVKIETPPAAAPAVKPIPIVAIQAPVRPQPVDPPAAQPVEHAAKGPLWTVQFGVFRDAANAHNTAIRLRRLGLSVLTERREGRFVLASAPLSQPAANAARQKAQALHLPGIYLSRHR